MSHAHSACYCCAAIRSLLFNSFIRNSNLLDASAVLVPGAASLSTGWRPLSDSLRRMRLCTAAGSSATAAAATVACCCQPGCTAGLKASAAVDGSEGRCRLVSTLPALQLLLTLCCPVHGLTAAGGACCSCCWFFLTNLVKWGQ
jgi:hypothetical protein